MTKHKMVVVVKMVLVMMMVVVRMVLVMMMVVSPGWKGGGGGVTKDPLAANEVILPLTIHNHTLHNLQNALQRNSLSQCKCSLI